MNKLLVDSLANRLISGICSAATSETSGRNEDQEMEDATTSNLGMISIVSLLVDLVFIFNFESFL